MYSRAGGLFRLRKGLVENEQQQQVYSVLPLLYAALTIEIQYKTDKFNYKEIQI